MVCFFSSNSSQQREYQNQLLSSSSNLGGTTKKQYSCYLKQWTAFFAKQKVDHISPPIAAVVDYLTELYSKGLTYSAITTAHSALSTYVMTDNGKPVGQHPLVTRLLKGIYKTQPPTPKYKQVRNVKVVLNNLSGLYPLETISPQELTYKVVMLMLLVSGQRPDHSFIGPKEHVRI